MKETYINEILGQIAREKNCTPEHVRMEIEALIDECWENPDPEIHAKWVAMSLTGGRPTIEEVIISISVEVVCSENQARNRNSHFPWF